MMAFWVKKDISYNGPRFDWIDEENVEVRRGLVGWGGASLSRKLSYKSVPKAARSRQRYSGKKWSADIFVVASSVAVNARFRALVEQFEPGIHLFAPIELQNNDGRILDGEFYFFSAQQDIDCILTDNDPSWFQTTKYGRILPNSDGVKVFKNRLSPQPTRRVYLSKPQIMGKHLWTGGPLGFDQLFFSDEFYAAFKKGRFKYLDVYCDCSEVDRAWLADENMGPMLKKWREFVAADRDISAAYVEPEEL